MVRNKQIKGENFLPNSNSSPPLEKLTGEVTACQKKKVYKKNQFHGNTYYKLEATNGRKNIVFFVYSNIVSKQLFRDVELLNFSGKKYLFFGEKIRKAWILHDWQELNQEEPILKAHE